MGALGEAKSGTGGRSVRLLSALAMPGAVRSVALVCGYLVAGAFGLSALLTPPGDPIGWAYIALAAVGLVFLQARGLTTFLWVLVASGGIAVAVAGVRSGWIEAVIGLALAVVGLIPASGNRPDRAADQSAEGEASAISDFTPSLGVQPEPTEAADQSRVASEASGATRAGVSLRSIGAFRIRRDGVDVTSELEDRPVSAFLFKYLLARSVAGESHVSRSALSEELSPAVPEASARERFRKHLYELQHISWIGGLVNANRTNVWLDLGSAESDLADLRRTSELVRRHGYLLDSTLAEQVHETLSRTDEEFLPGFEELENRITQGRGTAGEVVASARIAIGNLRAELIRAVAEHDDALNRPEATIGLLQDALNAMPDRQDLARLLVVAYLKTGQTARAAEVRRQFALKQE